ncbi:rhodanese-like domain-containing protein [Sedimenticola thiotaurini]|uniref:Sulfurtransferase n=1 Tax=Sedimenticola thiotaurini TaxID=1543721 RepID=A0A0F7JYK1_9GAMM|nr:rhodanese-like domain-containing protein [Sedimenticola thiotaurini]AKH20807.1 sulfurtransferase [Sedimenticola thiotaurini]
MDRKTYRTLVAEQAVGVAELFPWDVQDQLQAGTDLLLLDIRCPDEFSVAHIAGSTNVPRGILELAVDYGYEETVPELVEARQRPIVVICRSGNRSILAASTLQLMGFERVASLRTGLRGWNDYELPLVAADGTELDADRVDELFRARVTAAQLGPESSQAA